MKRKKFKIVKTSLIEYLLSASLLIIILLFILILIMFYQNITLEDQSKELKYYLEEYKLIKKEIDILIDIKENYEVVLNNNNELQITKQKLENKISELERQTLIIENKIDKLK